MASTTFVDGNPLTAAQMNTLGDTVDGYATTATSAGTTVLTVASKYQQFFTGSTTHTVTMPVASTLVVGWKIRVVNNSSGIVTVQSSGANTIYAVPAGGDVIFTCILASGTTAASWDYKDLTLASAPTFVSVCAVQTSGSLAVSSGVQVVIPLATADQWDTDAFHDTVTNNSRITIPTGKTGKYLITMALSNGQVCNYAFLYFMKNGSNTGSPTGSPGAIVARVQANVSNTFGLYGSLVTTLTAGDYIEMGYQSDQTNTMTYDARFTATYLGA